MYFRWPAAPVSSSARPDRQTVEPICVCQVDDGLVQGWVSKARAVAISKGFKPLPRCCRDMGDGYVCVLWKGHEGGCSGHREAAPRPSMAAALDRIGHIINDAPYRLEERDGAWQAFLQNRAIIEGAK